MTKPTHDITNKPELARFVDSYINFLDIHSKDVKFGSDLLDSGIKTEFIQKMELFMVNPLQALLDQRQMVDANLYTIVDGFVNLFFEKAKKLNIVKSAFKKRNGSATMYMIVLNQDNFNNRNEIFYFLDHYSSLGVYDKLPIYFQFVPTELEEKFITEESVA
ncbi:MAG TPA: hypothetical protein VK718_03885 [Ferruginibacter sp.]|jgi:hypothetical protein|nr:hypothetical protein [Ferruginibacter sp.]